MIIRFDRREGLEVRYTTCLVTLATKVLSAKVHAPRMALVLANRPKTSMCRKTSCSDPETLEADMNNAWKVASSH